MALTDHLRELRARLIRSTLVVIVAFGVALFFYNHLLDLIFVPYDEARERLNQDVKTEPVVSDLGGPLLLQLKLCGVVGLIAASPYWLYQIWAFILPGLHASERKWSRIFAAIAGPLFFAGVATGYLILPKAIEVLINFTPQDTTNLIEFGKFFSFITRMLLIFGISFERSRCSWCCSTWRAWSPARRWATTDPGSSSGLSSSRPWRPPPPTRSPCCSWRARCSCSSWSPRSSPGWSTDGEAGATGSPS